MWDLVCLHWKVTASSGVLVFFQVCKGRELNLVEIRNSWLFLTKIFFTHLLFMEPILIFPQGSESSNTVCLLKRKRNLKMDNLKITSNHRKSEFSSHKTAYKVIEYHCVVTSCDVAKKDKFSNFSTSLYSRKLKTKRNLLLEQVKFQSFTSQQLYWVDFPHPHTKSRSLCTWSISMFYIRSNCFPLLSHFMFSSYVL